MRSMPEPLCRFADHFWEEYLRKIEAAAAPLSDEQLWWRPNEGSNSIANLVEHLRGNLSQWVLAGLGGESFERHRSAEFAARPEPSASPTGEQLIGALRAVVVRCRAVAARLTAADLARSRKIQGYELDGASALFHAVEHMSYHTGQIVYIAKMLGAELDFYPQHRGE